MKSVTTNNLQEETHGICTIAEGFIKGKYYMKLRNSDKKLFKGRFSDNIKKQLVVIEKNKKGEEII